MVEVNLYSETMKRVADILNKNDIRYAIAGGVVAELRTGEVRSHKDIDLAIFEEDLPKIIRLLKENGISFRTQIIDEEKVDNWADTTEHNLIAQDNNTGTDIGFFIYSNQDEQFDDFGELVSDAGFVRKTDINYKGKNITLRERMNDVLQNYLFSPNRYEELDGIKIKVQPLAYIMMLKARNMRKKDREDLVNTTQLLSDEEIDEYNKFKNSILNIHSTAQLGKNAKEGSCEDVKHILDIIPGDEERG